MAHQTSATQWFERTLDDSAPRRLYLPQAFLAADACLKIAQNLASGLIVNREIIAKEVQGQLPYMATENLIMAAVTRGADRQEAHEVIRARSHQVTANIKAGRSTASELIQLLEKEPLFQGIDFRAELDAKRYIGRSPQQVEEFLQAEVEPIRQRYYNRLGQKAELRV
jgi:adenylosuccinate lyase